MSKEIDWGLMHGEGDIVCECDQCGKEYCYPFEDGDVDFRDCQQEIEDLGWISKRIKGEWYDFCSKKCLDKFLEKTK